jgi:hypothetical protein
LAENICPRVLFTGIPVDYKKELMYAFGDYVEAYEDTTNTSRARSAACIALFPTGNSIGTWVLWKIDTRSHVRRSNMVKLVTTDTIISIMNAVASEERGDVRVRRDTPEEERLLENQAEVPSETPETVRLEETPETHPEETQLEIRKKAQQGSGMSSRQEVEKGKKNKSQKMNR